MRGTTDAPGWDLQLRIAGVPDSGGPSASSDPATGGRGAGAIIATLRWDLRERGRPARRSRREQLLRALLLQVLYTIWSERQLIEQIDYNLLYRWFVGLELDDEVFSATVFTKNRERLLKGEIAQHFFEAVLAQAESEGLVSRSTSRWTGR